MNGAVSNRAPRVVAILPRGEAIRNFVYSGALDELARTAELHILSIHPNDEIWEHLSGRFDDVIRLDQIEDRWIVRFIREILDLAHGRWLWSSGAQVRWEWRDQEAATLGGRIKRTTKKLLCYPFASRRGLEALSAIEIAASRLLKRTRRFNELFAQIRPDLVFNGSQVHSGVSLPAVHAACEMGIPTATFVFSWDNLTSQGRIFPEYDYYIVWNETLRDGLLEIYRTLSPRQVLLTGTPQFDFHFRPEFFWTREEFCERVGLDPKRPIVLYSTGMANHVLGEPWVAERIADMLAEMEDPGSPQLMVRVLPKGPQGAFDDLKARRKDILIPEIKWEQRWLTPTLEDTFILTNTLRHADLGINIASTISLELCMLDKPVINVAFPPPHLDPNREFDYTRYYDFEHYRPIVDSGAIDMAYSEQELRQQIAANLADPGRLSGQRRALIEKFFGGRLDGKSSSRVAAALFGIAEQSERDR